MKLLAYLNSAFATLKSEKTGNRSQLPDCAIVAVSRITEMLFFLSASVEGLQGHLKIGKYRSDSRHCCVVKPNWLSCFRQILALILEPHLNCLLLCDNSSRIAMCHPWSTSSMVQRAFTYAEQCALTHGKGFNTTHVCGSQVQSAPVCWCKRFLYCQIFWRVIIVKRP